MKLKLAGCALSLLALLISPSGLPAADFIAFESGPVRPLALSPDGDMLFVANTPDNRLEVIRIDHSGLLTHLASIPVGLEPVAVAARTGSGRRMGIDRDRDTILDGLDNCPAASNRNQADADGNGVGDACETIPSK